MRRFALPGPLVVDLCERLGTPLPAGPEDLAAFYRAWHATVPFDNIDKNLARVRDRPPPGADPVAVAERFLTTGLGGTCWGHCAVVSGLLGAAGVDTSIGLDRMRRTDGVIDFHAFVVARDGASSWVLDPVHVSGDPLLLQAGARGNQGVIATGLDADGDRLTHWFRLPGGATDVRYAVLSTALDADDVAAFVDLSVRFSGIPDGRLHHRRFAPGELASLRVTESGAGNPPGRFSVQRWTTRAATDPPGPVRHAEAYDDPDEAFAAVGYPPAARQAAEAAGLLGIVP